MGEWLLGGGSRKQEVQAGFRVRVRRVPKIATAWQGMPGGDRIEAVLLSMNVVLALQLLCLWLWS